MLCTCGWKVTTTITKGHCLDDINNQSFYLSLVWILKSLRNRKGMKKTVQTQIQSEILFAFPITFITHELNHLHFQNPLQLELGFQYRHKCYQSLVEIREESRILPVLVFVKNK